MRFMPRGYDCHPFGVDAGSKFMTPIPIHKMEGGRDFEFNDAGDYDAKQPRAVIFYVVVKAYRQLIDRDTYIYIHTYTYITIINIYSYICQL